MTQANGVYEGVALTFNQDANSDTYGAILSGAQEMKNLRSGGQVQAPAQNQNTGVQPNNDQTGLSRIAPLNEDLELTYEPIDESNIIWN